jgi:hypothetical protein
MPIFTPQDSKFIDQLLEWFEESNSESNTWRNLATENLGYFNARGHWTREEIERAELEQRPLITVPAIFRFLNFMSGVERQGRQAARVVPVGIDSDPLIADILTLAIRNVDNDSLSKYILSDTYLHGQIVDRGYLRWVVRFRGIWPTIELQSIDPRDVFEDPAGREYDMRDHKYLSTCRWLADDELVNTFGKNESDKQRIREQLTAHKIFDDERFARNERSGRKKVCLFETQYREYERFIWAYNEDTKEYIHDADMGDMSQLTDAGYNIYVDSRPVTKIARWAGNMILEQKDHFLPNGQFDITKYSPYYALGEDTSMVELLKSQQLELNANRSDMRNLIGKAPKGIIFITDEAGLSEEDISEMGAMGGVFKVPTLDAIKFEDTSNFFSALTAFANMYQQSSREMQETTGVTETLQGQLKSSTSGVVFNSARTQAAVGLEMALDNFERSQLLHYKKLVPIIQQFFPSDKMMRISDDQYSFLTKEAEENEIEFVQVSGNNNLELLNKYHESIATIERDLSIGEYDVHIDFASSATTQREANFQLLLNLMNNVPNMAEFLAPMAIRTSHLPNKEEALDDLKKGQQAQAQAQEDERNFELEKIKLQAQLKNQNRA